MSASVPFEDDPYEDDWDDDLDCTWCNGDGQWEGSKFGDPLWYDEDRFYPCPACSGTGKRSDQRLF